MAGLSPDKPRLALKSPRRVTRRTPSAPSSGAGLRATATSPSTPSRAHTTAVVAVTSPIATRSAGAAPPAGPDARATRTSRTSMTAFERGLRPRNPVLSGEASEGTVTSAAYPLNDRVLGAVLGRGLV